MKTYKAGAPKDAELRRELARIEQAAMRADPYAELEYLHAAPDKTRAGQVILADGVDWNPGSGEGMYRRDKTNTSWVFLG